MVNGPVITSAQLRAARAWLNWSQDDLSARSGISQRSIARYERGHSVPYADTLVSLRTAFEAAGIRFQFVGQFGKGISIE